MSDDNNLETPAPPQQEGPRERPAWMWKVLWFIAAMVVLQAVLVWYFWVKL